MTFPNVDVFGSEVHGTSFEFDFPEQIVAEVDNKKDGEIEMTLLFNECDNSTPLNLSDVFGSEVDDTFFDFNFPEQIVAEDDNKKDGEIEENQKKENEMKLLLNECCNSTPLNLSLSFDDVAKTWSTNNIYLDKQVSQGENGTMDSAEAKHEKRKQANREASRRLREKHEAELTELETKVAELRLKRETSLRHINHINQKCNDADVHIQVLTAEFIERKARVEMKKAEIITLVESNPRLLASPEIRARIKFSFNGSFSHMFTDAALTMPSPEISTMNMSSFNGSFSHMSTDAVIPRPSPEMSTMNMSSFNGSFSHMSTDAALTRPSPKMSTMNMSSFNGSFTHMSTDVIPMRDGLNQLVYPAAEDNSIFHK